MANSSHPPSPWNLSGRSAKLTAGDFSAAVAVDRPGLGIHDIAWAGQPLDAVGHWLAFSEPGPAPSDRVRAIEDVYVRGHDLVVVYAENKEHPLRYFVYWRSLGEADLCGAAAGLDVVVSVQTSVLDAKPAASLSSRCSAEGAWSAAPPQRIWRSIPQRRLDAALEQPFETATEINALGKSDSDDVFLFDLAAGDWTYAEMIHPGDRTLSYALVWQPDEESVAASPDSDTDHLLFASSVVTTRHQVLGLQLEKGVLLRARTRVVLTRREGSRDVVAACRDAFERADLPLTT
ncbi:MAG: hypothetical protein WD875_02340 [Pirellulales bacterium]